MLGAGCWGFRIVDCALQGHRSDGGDYLPVAIGRHRGDKRRRRIAAEFGQTSRQEIAKSDKDFAPLCLHPDPGLLGNARGNHHPTEELFLGEVAIPPVATRPRFVDKEQALALALELTNQFVDIALPGAERP